MSEENIQPSAEQVTALNDAIFQRLSDPAVEAAVIQVVQDYTRAVIAEGKEAGERTLLLVQAMCKAVECKQEDVSDE